MSGDGDGGPHSPVIVLNEEPVRDEKKEGHFDYWALIWAHQLKLNVERMQVGGLH